MHENTMNKQAIAGIKCDVTNCTYNQSGSHCVAGQIKVGPQFASTAADTTCATFKPE